MRASALKRGVKLTSISRPIRRTDFEEFDLILAMDKSNKGRVWFRGNTIVISCVALNAA
jgi:protein-tyrosine phosphatase